MKHLIFIITAILVLAKANGQEKMISFENVQPIASKALPTFMKLITKQNYKAMGFEVPGQEKEAYLGDPIRVFIVRLDELQEYEPGSDPAKLLSDCKSVIYPVLVNSQVQSSIEIEKIEETWQATKFGGTNLVRMLTRIRTLTADTTKSIISSFFAIQVPALNLYFIAFRTDNLLMLTPVLDNQGFNFKAGIPISADKVFKIILPAAKAHNGLPG